MDNDKLSNEFRRLVEANGRDPIWVSQYFGQLVQWHENTRPTPAPVGILDAE